MIFQAGRLLITRRPTGAHLAGLWEFPGGKRRPRESFQQCLVRELREELGIEVAVTRLLDEVTHTYPEKTVRLKFFLCRLLAGRPRPLGCAAVRWVSPRELGRYNFPAADARLLERLVADTQLWRTTALPPKPRATTCPHKARQQARGSGG